MNNNYEVGFFDRFLNNNSYNSIMCDVYEKDNSYIVEMDLPGFKKDNLSINFRDGYLTVMGNRISDNKEEVNNYVRKERYQGRFHRQFYVGKVKIEKIDAVFKDGVLKVIIPKIDDEMNTKIIKIR